MMTTDTRCVIDNDDVGVIRRGTLGAGAMRGLLIDSETCIE